MLMAGTCLEGPLNELHGPLFEYCLRAVKRTLNNAAFNARFHIYPAW